MNIPSLLQDAAADLYSAQRSGASSMPDVLTAAELNVLEDVEAAGYPIIGTGTSRVCIELSDSTVVKLARPIEGSYDGARDNKLEHQLFTRASDDVESVLAPVHHIASDNTWLVMERATEIRGYEHELTEDFLSRCEAAGIGVMEGDTPLWNVGYIPSRGCDCFIDYAHL